MPSPIHKLSRRGQPPLRAPPWGHGVCNVAGRDNFHVVPFPKTRARWNSPLPEMRRDLVKLGNPNLSLMPNGSEAALLGQLPAGLN